ncbi:MAG: hypothetical protein ACO3L1_00560 [Flavobacteriaceae bacterium]
MKEFFALFILLSFISCTSVSTPQIDATPNEEISYELKLLRQEEVVDTFSTQEYPMQLLQDELDVLIAFSSRTELIEQLNRIVVQIQELETRPEPTVLTDRGLKSRLKLLRTYLLQLKGALEENDGVNEALSEVNQTNQALIAYWNAMSGV